MSLTWFCIWFGIFSTCGRLWSRGVGENRETDEEHDEDCVERRGGVWVEEEFSWLR